MKGLNLTNSQFTILFGIANFICFMVYLHQVQIGYQPTVQLMSELALGKQGGLLFGAFASLTVSLVAAAVFLRRFAGATFLRVLLVVSAACFLGAGYFELDTQAQIHVLLVSLAFGLLGLGMYLMPRYVMGFQSVRARWLCWGLGAGMVLFIALGLVGLPAGVAQRLAALCLLLWLTWIGLTDRARL